MYEWGEEGGEKHGEEDTRILASTHHTHGARTLQRLARADGHRLHLRRRQLLAQALLPSLLLKGREGVDAVVGGCQCLGDEEVVARGGGAAVGAAAAAAAAAAPLLGEEVQGLVVVCVLFLVSCC